MPLCVSAGNGRKLQGQKFRRLSLTKLRLIDRLRSHRWLQEAQQVTRHLPFLACEAHTCMQIHIDWSSPYLGYSHSRDRLAKPRDLFGLSTSMVLAKHVGLTLWHSPTLRACILDTWKKSLARA